LPVLTLALTYMALYQRLMRGAMVETRASGWVRAAKARGLPHGRIVRGHIARPALLPVVTMLGLQAGTMLGGSVVIETVFAIPGLGSLAYLAVSRRDLPLVAGVILAGTLMVIVINLLVDVSYARLDPRVTDQRARRASR
jgi:peptide/nickel transport system permease protein